MKTVIAYLFAMVMVTSCFALDAGMSVGYQNIAMGDYKYSLKTWDGSWKPVTFEGRVSGISVGLELREKPFEWLEVTGSAGVIISQGNVVSYNDVRDTGNSYAYSSFQKTGTFASLGARLSLPGKTRYFVGCEYTRSWVTFEHGWWYDAATGSRNAVAIDRRFKDFVVPSIGYWFNDNRTSGVQFKCSKGFLAVEIFGYL